MRIDLFNDTHRDTHTLRREKTLNIQQAAGYLLTCPEELAIKESPAVYKYYEAFR